MSFSIYSAPEPGFNRKRINLIILKIQRGDELVKADLKFDLFKLMKNIVVKNIANYKMLYRNSPISEEGLTSVEMESECYLVLEKCLTNFKVKKTNCFYFYYNKSLSRSFYRMFDKNIRKREKHGDYKQNIKCISNTNTNHAYGMGLILDLMDLTAFDKKVILSKIDNEKKEDFIKKNKTNLVKYQASLNKVKQQLIILKKEEQI